MMRVLTEDAVLGCAHVGGKGTVETHAQSFVRIEGAHVLVGVDPSGTSLSGCPVQPPLKLCTSSLVPAAGHSSFVSIGGTPICLDTITGPTDAVPPAIYVVKDPGQSLVEVSG